MTSKKMHSIEIIKAFAPEFIPDIVMGEYEIKKPRQAQAKKIEEALHRLGHELLAVEL